MHNFINEFDQLIQSIFAALGMTFEAGKDYEIIDRGSPHDTNRLPPGKMGIYAFYHDGGFLKIGKAGTKSGARFCCQHYFPRSCRSNLAASLLADEKMNELVTENTVGDWIKQNCRRIDIFLDKKCGEFSLRLVEAVLHHRYKPKYEKA